MFAKFFQKVHTNVVAAHSEKPDAIEAAMLSVREYVKEHPVDDKEDDDDDDEREKADAEADELCKDEVDAIKDYGEYGRTITTAGW